MEDEGTGGLAPGVVCPAYTRCPGMADRAGKGPHRSRLVKRTRSTRNGARDLL